METKTRVVSYQIKSFLVCFCTMTKICYYRKVIWHSHMRRRFIFIHYFLISKVRICDFNNKFFVISKNIFWYQKIFSDFFLYQEIFFYISRILFFYIKNSIIWYQKIIYIFWYQELYLLITENQMNILRMRM